LIVEGALRLSVAIAQAPGTRKPERPVSFAQITPAAAFIRPSRRRISSAKPSFLIPRWQSSGILSGRTVGRRAQTPWY
jgi:hypothetical protein